MTLRCHSGAPSSWVARFAPLIRAGGGVLDVACGKGRHARLLAQLGYRVVAVDRDAEALATLAGLPGVELREADLEAGSWPFPGHQFAAVVVTNYLHRPLFPRLLETLEADGMLIYETFAEGNERYGRPSNPQFLLRSGELLEAVQGRLAVVAYEHGLVSVPGPAVIQRICAVGRAPAEVALPACFGG